MTGTGFYFPSALENVEFHLISRILFKSMAMICAFPVHRQETVCVNTGIHVENPGEGGIIHLLDFHPSKEIKLDAGA